MGINNIKVFPVTIYQGDSESESIEIGRAWGDVYLEVPSMVAYAQTATCQINILGGNSTGGNFYYVMGSNEHYSEKINGINDNEEALYQFFSKAGYGTYTSANMIDDASTPTGTTGIYTVRASPGNALYINRIMFELRDTGKFSAENFGAGADPLSHGVTVKLKNDAGTVIDITANGTIINNAGFAKYAYDLTFTDSGVGDDFLHSRWSFYKAGYPIRLNGCANDYLELSFQGDDLSGINAFYCNAQGYRRDCVMNDKRILHFNSGFKYAKIRASTAMSTTVNMYIVCNDN